MFALVFFMSSTMLYSIESDTTNFLDVEGELEVEGWFWGTTTGNFFGGSFSFVVAVPALLFFEVAWAGSKVLLLLVVTGKASSSFSVSEFGSIKSHIPWHSATSSSSSVCEVVSSSSSSCSESALDITLGGFDSVFL